MEGGTAHLDVGVPNSCGVIGFRRHLEGVEPVGALRGDEFGVELSLGVIDFQSDGVSVGNPLLPVFQHKGDVQRVARTPDASFAVDEAFQPLLYLLAAHVEPADRLLFAVHHADVCLLLVGFGDYYERNSLGSDFCKSFAVRLTRPDGLQLEVVDGHSCFACGSGIQQVADGNPQLVEGVLLDNHP